MICIPYWVLWAAVGFAVCTWAVWKADVILDWVLARISTPLNVDTEAFMSFLRTHGMEEATPAMAQHELTPLTRQAFREAADREQRRRTFRTRLITVGISVAIWAALWTLLR